MQIQINYGACTVQYDNNGTYKTPSQCFLRARIKMSLKTDKYFFHFMKLIRGGSRQFLLWCMKLLCTLSKEPPPWLAVTGQKIFEN